MTDTEDHSRRLWIKYKNEYDYNFEKDTTERNFHIFNENLRFINHENNMKNQLYKCELNCTAHLPHNEYQNLLIKEAFDPTRIGARDKPNKDKLKVKLRKDFDWRIYNGVTESMDIDYFWKKKNLWVQSVLDCVQSNYKIHKKKTVFLTLTEFETELNDMANVGAAGLTKWALLQSQNFGLLSQKEHASNSHLAQLEDAKRYKIEGYSLIRPKDSSVEKAIMHYGPAIINIDASEKSFRFYKSGIYNPIEDRSKSTVNHIALVVGFDHICKQGTWVIKNCWGKDWGNNGFINVSMKALSLGVNSNVHVVY